MLWLLYDFLSLKTDVNVPSKNNKQKNLERKKLIFGPESHGRKQQDPDPVERICGSGYGSVPTCHGSTTLSETKWTIPCWSKKDVSGSFLLGRIQICTKLLWTFIWRIFVKLFRIVLFREQQSNDNRGDDFLNFLLYFIQQCYICRPTRFHCVGGCWIEPMTTATLALSARRSNHSARSHPLVIYWMIIRIFQACYGVV